MCCGANPSSPPTLGYQPKAVERKALSVIGALEEKDVIQGVCGGGGEAWLTTHFP